VKIPLEQQIEEIARELALRAAVYPRLVAKGEMRSALADDQVARLSAVLATLRWLARNEAKIKETIKDKIKAKIETKLGPEAA
jgi:hypothetical protein